MEYIECFCEKCRWKILVTPDELETFGIPFCPDCKKKMKESGKLIEEIK